mgnify:FL=1
MIGHGLDGIEVYYPKHTPEQTKRYAEIAREHGLLATGGSDFHGLTPDAQYEFGEIELPADTVAALDARIAARRG